MEEKRLHEQYVKSIHSRGKPKDLPKIAGMLVEKGHREAPYVEAQSLFLNEQYSECSKYCKFKRSKKTYAINEFYIASLMHLGRYDDVRFEILRTREYPISPYCVVYLLSYMEKRDEQLLPRKDYPVGTADFENSDFKRVFNEYINSELLSVFEEQKEVIELVNLGADEETLTFASGKLLKAISCIHIVADELDKIAACIRDGNSIDPVWVYQFYLKGFTLEQIRDIIRLIDYERRLGLFPELDKTIVEHENSLIKEIEDGNEEIAGYMMEVSIIAEEKPDILSYKGRKIVQRCGEKIAKAFPDIAEYGKKKAEESKIYTFLTERSKKMMEAAIWQYKAVEADEKYGFRDAGMFCLSYIRLLELEMNERILPVLAPHAEELNVLIKDKDPSDKKNEERAILELFKDLPEEDPEKEILKKWKKHKDKVKSFNYTWKNLYEVCKTNTKGLTAGQWYFFFSILSKKKEKIKREALYIKLHWILQSEVFNEKGMAALNSGRIESFFNPNIVERFRNPPAHTRYVMVSIANKCKDYVEKTVEELHAYYK